MRVKVGDQWFEATPEAPIAVELSQRDRTLIAGMSPDATRYGVFHDRCDWPREDMRAWLAHEGVVGERVRVMTKRDFQNDPPPTDQALLIWADAWDGEISDQFNVGGYPAVCTYGSGNYGERGWYVIHTEYYCVRAVTPTHWASIADLEVTAGAGP